MATAVPNALNGTAPERTPVINVYTPTLSGTFTFAQNYYVFGTSGSFTGNNVANLSSTPATATPLYVYRNGLRQMVGAAYDYTVSGTAITFTPVLSAGETILVDYFV